MLEKEEVILVDENDVELGTMEKMEAHKKGVLHRAFSVFVFNSKGEFLLQQRASSKYHSPLLWTNTCCSHPRKNESLEAAANRRLSEEMGMETQLKHVHHFIYKAILDDGMIEHELDHVFFGISDQIPEINRLEVNEYKFIGLPELEKALKNSPENYTAWFRLLMPVVTSLLSKEGL